MADRNQAKQRRQAQNRARRAQIAARTEAAQRKTREASEASAGRPRRTTRGGARPARGTATPRQRIERGGLLAKLGWNEPGGSAVIAGAGLTLVASLALLVVKILPADGPWEVVKLATKAGAATKGAVSDATRAQIMTHASIHNETVLKNAGGRGWFLLLSPAVVAWLSVAIARPANRRRTWAVGALGLFFFVTIIAGSTGILYLPAFAVFAYGTYQAYKVARVERMAAAAAGVDGGTIATTAREAAPDGDEPGADDDVTVDESGEGAEPAEGGAGATGKAAGTGQPQSVFGTLFKPRPQRSPGRRRPASGEPASAVDEDPLHEGGEGEPGESDHA
jgi:hypothetical protein